MTDAPRQIGVIRAYDDLLDAFRAQVQALGLNYAILDDLTCYTDTYATKLLGQAHHVDRSEDGKRIRSGRRNLSPQAFDAYLDALGLDLIAVENPKKAEKTKQWLARKIEGRVGPQSMLRMRSMPRPTWLLTSKKAHELNRIRNKKLPAERRREIARNAARKRWKTPQVSEIAPAEFGALPPIKSSGITRGADKKKSSPQPSIRSEARTVRRR